MQRFSDLGTRTLRVGIPTNRHLFPHQFHEKIKNEHDQKASKLICKLKAGPKPWTGSKSFQDSSSFRQGQQSGADRKRKWACKPGSSSVKYSKVPDERQILPSLLATAAADYLTSAPPLSLLDNQMANRLGTFLTNWNLLNGQMDSSNSRPGRTAEGANEGAIQPLISKGAISVMDLCPQQFISTLFVVEKGVGTGEFCPVINLKALNRFLP